jgi:DivIVA domain-containing protein
MTRCLTRNALAEVGMLALEVLGGVVVLLVLAFVLARDVRLLDDEPEDTKDTGLPVDRLLRSDDIPRLRFRVGLRGYRMSDVDAVLDAVHRALAAAEGRDRMPAEPAELAEQPATSTERPLSELEDARRVPDDPG